MKSIRMIFVACGLFAVIASSGCATVYSHQQGASSIHEDEGLVYRLPKRGINISVSFEQGKPPELTLTEGMVFADASGPVYFAKIRRNGVGETDAEINVTEQGLLSTTSAKYTSKIDDFIKALAGTAASLSTSGGDGAPPPSNQSSCPTASVASFTSYLGTLAGGFQLDGTGSGAFKLAITTDCIVNVTVQRAGWTLSPPGRPDQEGHDTPTAAAGYFYRVNMPYMVRASLENTVKQTIVMLPDESKTYYIELPRSLLASTDTTTTFQDGVLTKHKQKADSEVIAAMKIPADLLRAYSSALGSFFDSFKATGLKESQAQTQEVLNEIQRQKLEACIIALRDDPTGKTSDTLCAGIALPSGS